MIGLNAQFSQLELVSFRTKKCTCIQMHTRIIPLATLKDYSMEKLTSKQYRKVIVK